MKLEWVFFFLQIIYSIYNWFILFTIIMFLLELILKIYLNKNIFLSQLLQKKNLNLDLVYKLIIFFINYHCYFLYVCFVLPFFFVQNLINVLKLFSNFFFKTRFSIHKPIYDNYEFGSFKSLIVLIFIKFPQTWSFLLFYFICLPNFKKNQLKKTINNLGFIFLTSRPMWFWNLSNELAEEIINIIHSDVWKRKKKIIFPLIFFKELKNIFYKITFKKLMFYYEYTKNLKLDIIDFKINGVDFLMKHLKTVDNLIILKNINMINLSGIPHIILCSDEKSYGQIMTKSKTVYLNPSEKIETNKLSDKQNVTFSLYNKQDLIKNIDYSLVKKLFLKLKINTPEDYCGFIFKTNLIYWTEVGEKLLWQNSNKDLSKILTIDSLPIIDEYRTNYTLDSKLFLRYKYSDTVIFAENFYNQIIELNAAKATILNTDLKQIYEEIEKKNYNEFADLKNNLSKSYEQLETWMGE